MITNTKTLLLVAALLCAAPLAAQTVVEERIERRAEAETGRDVEFSERMRQAEERLAEAARRVAELSSERLGAMGDVQRFAFDFSNRPRLGVTIGGDDSDGPVEGVSVIGVTPGSAAADAGLRTGDIITSLNGEALGADSVEQANLRLLELMKNIEEGDSLDIEYLRDGKVGKVTAEPKIADRQMFAWAGPESIDGRHFPRMPNAPEIVEKFSFMHRGFHGAWGDMEIVELNEGLGRYFGAESGLLVINAPKSEAFKLQDGDVIQSIDGREPTSVNHCMRILGSYQPGETLELQIMRDKRRRKIEIEVPDDRSSWVAPRAPDALRPVAAPDALRPVTAPDAARPAAAPAPSPAPRPERTEIEST